MKSSLLRLSSPYFLHKNDPFIPYFQYRIGPYQPDHYLYFSKEPDGFRYRNEIFRKMKEYNGYELIRFVEFHYKAFEDKEVFVQFLRFEALDHQRFLRTLRYFFWVPTIRDKSINENLLLWTEEKSRQLEQMAQERLVAVDEENAAAVTGQQGEAAAGGAMAEKTPENGQPFVTGIDVLTERLEKEFSAILRTFQGKAELYNELHLTKFIQLLQLLQNLREPGKKVVPLFKTFSNTDMAAMLRQLAVFGDKKTNTIEVRIGVVNKATGLNDPAIQKLTKALQDFFFR